MIVLLVLTSYLNDGNNKLVSRAYLYSKYEERCCSWKHSDPTIVFNLILSRKPVSEEHNCKREDYVELAMRYDGRLESVA